MMTLHRTEGEREVLSSSDGTNHSWVMLDWMWHGRLEFILINFRARSPRFDKLDSEASAGRSLLLSGYLTDGLHPVTVCYFA